MKDDIAPRPVLLADYRSPDFLIDKVDLVIALDPARTRVKATLAIRRNPAAKTPRAPLILDGELLKLDRIAINGEVLKETDFRNDDSSLTVRKPPNGPFTFETTTYVSPEANTALQGIYLSRGVYCSQCEAQGFRRITYFLDRPDVLSVYTVRLEADVLTAPILLANGNPVERGMLAGGKRHYAVWRDPHPKPCYLFAIVGGDLGAIASTFKTCSGRDVDLAIYVEHGKESRAYWAMDALKRSFAWDEKRFGREYDLSVFNIVAVSDFNMGAMENKGLNIFNDRLILASAETATDANFEAIESVVAHEYFHNWTGNRITCRDWFQLCLKEGLTVYRDQEFSADERSRTVQRIADVRQLKALQFPEDQGPLAHPVRPSTYIEINNFYTPTVYEKGAELVRMIETILGREAFRAGMDLYFERCDGQAATVEDFIKCFEDASGRDLQHFMRWYSQAGTPELVCDFKYDRAKKSAELTIVQSLKATPGQQKKQPLFIPVRVGLLQANGKEIDVELDSGEQIRPSVLAVTRAKQTFRFKNVASKPTPSLLRGFSAPVNVTINLSDADLSFLMTHDGDLFNRWQAANRFATRAILQAIQRTRRKPGPDPSAKYAAALLGALRDQVLDDAYKAELLKLPTPSDIAREQASKVDPEVVLAAHRAFSERVLAKLGDVLREAYETTSKSKTFSPDAKSAGRRALRNAALTVLTSAGKAEDAILIERHYLSATNMTDAAHALALIAHIDGAARERVFDNFFARWRDDHLVIDMWFAAQAQSSLPDALDRVSALTRHPLFKITAPNKVRALIGAFAMSNLTQFNRADGAGYDFVAERVIEIDRINPQVAARLLGAFRSYRSLEAKRRRRAHAAIERVAAAANVSRDSREIVSRMLDEDS
ncbi:MAG: aminopeptidase N [Hyphomicrobium sp.]